MLSISSPRFVDSPTVRPQSPVSSTTTPACRSMLGSINLVCALLLFGAGGFGFSLTLQAQEYDQVITQDQLSIASTTINPFSDIYAVDGSDSYAVNRYTSYPQSYNWSWQNYYPTQIGFYPGTYWNQPFSGELTTIPNGLRLFNFTYKLNEACIESVYNVLNKPSSDWNQMIADCGAYGQKSLNVSMTLYNLIPVSGYYNTASAQGKLTLQTPYAYNSTDVAIGTKPILPYQGSLGNINVLNYTSQLGVDGRINQDGTATLSVPGGLAFTFDKFYIIKNIAWQMPWGPLTLATSYQPLDQTIGTSLGFGNPTVTSTLAAGFNPLKASVDLKLDGSWQAAEYLKLNGGFHTTCANNQCSLPSVTASFVLSF